MQFIILPPNEKRRITACVGLVSLQGQPEKFVMIKNKRGWDIPGGHVEGSEKPLEAFARELTEEAACTLLPGASMIAILESISEPTTGIALFRGFCTKNSFVPTDEIESRKFVTADELIKGYFGDKDLLQRLITLI